MHGLTTIVAMNRRNAEAERIMAQDHSAEIEKNARQLDADIAEVRKGLAPVSQN